MLVRPWRITKFTLQTVEKRVGGKTRSGCVNGDLSNIQRDFKIVCKGDLELGVFCKEPTADDKGNPVSFRPRLFNEAVAYVNKDRVIVKIKQVPVPGAMVTAHDEYLRAFGNSRFEVGVRLSKLRTYKNVRVQQPAPTTIISEVNSLTSTHQQLNSLNQDEELSIIDEEGNLLEIDDKEIAELSRAYGQHQLQQQ
ncbi:hypothetical protein BDC45DRAFT_574062 [Circinella umbellata]|nr:hypothetical protein BDC45DRAFT_574062 [Circinella umbellata]